MEISNCTDQPVGFSDVDNRRITDRTEENWPIKTSMVKYEISWNWLPSQILSFKEREMFLSVGIVANPLEHL